MALHPSISASATAHPNIAFIKYWGNVDPALRIPANGSLSMNLGGLSTRTTVTFDPGLAGDELLLGGKPITGQALQRVSALLDRVRLLADLSLNAHVESSNNFPAGAGIASSASAFAALSLAASTAAGLQLSEPELSRLARTGSGSACRSIPGGFVEWQAGHDHETSYAFSIAEPSHWDLVDCVAIVSHAHKRTGSSEGHHLAGSSPLQPARLADASRRLEACRAAVCERDFPTLAEVVEQDSNLMHAVMMTSQPPLFYWEPVTLAVLQAVSDWRKQGLPAFYTVDAGPNVHVLCPAEAARSVARRLRAITGVQHVLSAHPGGPAQLLAAG
jgi:diphosphomevalonate decarboxylase